MCQNFIKKECWRLFCNPLHVDCIGESQRLLMNSELPVSCISDQLGFNDSSHFCRTFKKYIGLTPSVYRRHFRGIHP
ncbi:AraC family transcriptional regulator [Clostridiaceae bacterium]|nr:AraC family transcriptional regulator [Clostridiaceae bacterium]